MSFRIRKSGEFTSVIGNQINSQSTVPQYNANKLQSIRITSTTPNDGEIMQYDSTLGSWVLATQSSFSGTSTVPIKVPNGTETLPSYTFTSDTSSGMYKVSDLNSTWTTMSLANSDEFRGITWVPELSKFFAAHNTISTSCISESIDGLNWTTIITPNQSCRSIIWAPELTRLVGLATGSSELSSDDNGATWQTRASPASNSWNKGAWSPELTLFVAISISGSPDRIMSSPDGYDWTLRSSVDPTAFGGNIAWSPELGIFVIVSGSNPANSLIQTSSNGIDWESQVNPGTINMKGLTWAPELTLFVAVGRCGSPETGVMTSPDGVDWTTRVSPIDWSELVWAPEISKFIAVRGTSEPQPLAMTSSDGITWDTNDTTPFVNVVAVAWSPELELAASVAKSGGLGMYSDILSSVNVSFDGTSQLSLSSSGLIVSGEQFLPPVVTTGERDAIANPLEGSVVYNTTTNVMNFYNGTVWGAI